MKIIAIANEKGGTGKTTVALNLAAALSRQKKKVLAIDLDRQANLSQTAIEDFPGVEGNKKGMGTVTEKQAKITDVIQETKNPNLSVIGVDFQISKMDNKLPVFDFLPLKKQFDYIVIDCPPGIRGATLAALKAANIIIIPNTTDQYSYSGTRAVINSIVAANEDAKVGILLNKHIPRLTISKQLLADFRALAEECGATLFKTFIRDSVAIREAQLMGEDIFSYAAKSPIANDFELLAKEIRKWK